jgi:uncharacterized membrane protein YfcA
MFPRHYSFEDEPLTTVLAVLLMGVPILMVVFVSGSLVSLLPSVWLRIAIPITVTSVGAVILHNLRSTETLRQVLILSVIIGLLAISAACIVALFGHSISRGNIVAVPRRTSLNYLYICALTVPPLVSSALKYQRRLREIDGPGV